MGYTDLQVIKLCDALATATLVLKEERLSQREEAVLESLVLSCPQISDGGETYILKDDLSNFCKNFIKALREGDASFLHKEKGYKGRLVDIEEFVEGKDYLNQKGSIRPMVKYELERIEKNMDNIREVVLTGCVTGDTVLSIGIPTNNPLKKFNTYFMSIKKLYDITSKKIRNPYAYDDFHTLSLKDNGAVSYNRIEKVFYNGIKKVYRVVTSLGKSITCTKEHKFIIDTQHNCKPLSSLKVGDTIICRAPAKKAEGRKKFNDKRKMVYSVPFHPYARKHTIAGKNYKRIYHYRIVIDASLNNMSEDELIKILRTNEEKAATLKYSDPKLVIHHIDGDETNDSLDNLLLVTKKEHDSLHGADLSINSGNCYVHEEQITEITFIGEEDVYDLQMQDPYRNYEACGINIVNSTGWGKSYLSRILMCRILYKLSMLHSPQYEYGLAPGSSIAIILQSQSLRLSKKILFNPVLALIASSPYFIKNFPFNRQVTSELQFPNHIYVSPVSGSEMATLGLDVYAGCFLDNQEYYSVDGTFLPIGKEGSKVAVRYKTRNSIEEGEATKPVFTGFKSLVKLTLDDGNTIISTYDQLFLGENNEGIKAGLCEGRRLLFSAVSNLRSRGNILNSTFETSTSYDIRGIPTKVSEVSTDSKTVKSEKDPEISNDMRNMRKDYGEGILYSSKIAQHVESRLRRKIRTYDTSSRNRRKKGVGEAQYYQATKTVPRICGEIKQIYQRETREGSCRDAGKVCNSGKSDAFWGASKKKVGRAIDGRKKCESSPRKRSASQLSKRKSQIYLCHGFRKSLLSLFPARDDSSGVAGFIRNTLAARKGSYGIYNKRSGSHVYPGFFSAFKYCGGQDKRIFKNKSFVGREEKEVQPNSDNRERNRTYGLKKAIQLATAPQMYSNLFLRDPELFTTRNCIRVEYLNIYAPVYDLENVGGSHYFLAKAGEGVIPAKNCMSEVNYFDVVENSQVLTMRGQDNTTYDQAVNAYTNLIQRLKNRFQDHGKIPGVLILDSAVHYPGDFLDRKAQEAKWDNQIHVVRHAIWDTLSQDKFSGNKFLVEVGNADRSSRIIETKEFAVPDSDIIEVPVEYKTDFERDIEKALRDFVGVATGHRRAFMPFKEAVSDAHTVYEALYNGQTLFNEEVIDITNYFDGPFEWEKLINKEYMRQISFNSKADFCMHVDLGISKDKVGLAVGHVQDYKMMPSTSFFSNASNSFIEMADMSAPVICIDGMMQITPPPGGEVSVDTLRGFMLYLSTLLNMKIVTMDSFEHVSFVQALRRIKGLRSGTVSTVATPIPYMELKAAYIEGRIIHQNFPIYTDELLFLEYDPKKRKIDHLPHKCFTGDTRVALLDGTNPTFEELAERYPNNEKFYVYSMSKNGIVAGEAHNPRITGRNAELVEITLDNFQVIRCTPEHLFMTINMDWIQAQNLEPDVSLMPLYRTVSTLKGNTHYPNVYDPITKKVDMIHKVIAKNVYDIPEGYVVHHIDNNKQNNSPDNLMVLTLKDHSRLHGYCRLDDSNYMAALRRGHKKYRENGGNEKSRENINRLFAEGKLKLGRDVCAEDGCFTLANAHGYCDKHFQKRKRVGEFGDLCLAKGCYSFAKVDGLCECHFHNKNTLCSIESCNNIVYKNGLCKWHRSKMNSIRKKAHQSASNHRVISVKKLNYTMDVWDIEVDKYHNFALTAGNFVHNSKDISDSVAGVVHMLTHKIAHYRRNTSSNKTEKTPQHRQIVIAKL